MRKHPAPLILLFFSLSCMMIACSPKRTGPSATPHIAPLPANSFAQVWFNDVHAGKDNIDKMFLREDTLFMYSTGQVVYALGARGGELRYIARPRVTGGTLRAPLLSGDYVIYPSGSSLEIFTTLGREVRSVDLEKPTRSNGIINGPKVYIGQDHTAGTGVLAKIDLNRPYHNTDWELMTNGALSAAPVMFDGIIYSGSEDGKIYAVDADRKPSWSLPGGSNTFNTQGKFVADLKADQYGLYASNTDSKLYCIDRQTGRLKWQYYAGAQLATSPVVFPATVYQYVPSVGIVAIDKASGTYNRTAKWIVKDGRQVVSEDQNNVYLKSRDGHILAVDKKTGQVLFASKSKWDLCATNLTDATIFATTHDGQVVAIKPVLREGEVGTIVMDFRPEPIALAR